MATVIDALIITLGLDSKGVGTGLQQAQSKLDDGIKSMTGKVLGPLTALLTGALAGGAIVKRFLDAADLGKLSVQLRTNVEDIQAWQGAAIAAGGSSEGLVNSAKALQSATGSKLPITDQLLRVSEQMQRLGGLRAVELGKKLGLDEATISVLRQGPQAVRELLGEQKQLVAFTTQDVASMQRVKQVYDQFKGLLFLLSSMVVKLFLPAVGFMSEKLQAAGGIIPTVRKKLALLSQWISENRPHILNAFAAIAAMITTRMVPALLRMAASAVAALLPFLPFIALVAGMVLLFDDFATYINGGESALEDLWKVFGSGPEIAAALSAAWEELKAAGLALWDGLKAAAAVFFGSFPSMIDNVKALFMGLVTGIVALFKGDFEGLGAALADIFVNIATIIAKIFSGLVNGIVNLFKTYFTPDSLLSGFKAMGGVFKGFFKGLFGGDGEAPEAPEAPQAPAAPAVPAAAPVGNTATPADAIPAAASAGKVVNNSETQVSVGQVVVNTQATDARGMAAGASGALNDSLKRNMALGANSGVAQK